MTHSVGGVIIFIVLLITGSMAVDHFIFQHRQRTLLAMVNKKADNEFQHTGIRAYARFPSGYGLDGDYVIRYPFYSSPSQREKKINEVFPNLFEKHYHCHRYWIVHPDESGTPTVSRGDGYFPDKPLGQWEKDELIELCGYRPGREMLTRNSKRSDRTYSLEELKRSAWTGNYPEITIYHYRDGLYAVGYPYACSPDAAQRTINLAIPNLEEAENYRGYFIVQHYPGQPPHVLPGHGALPYLSESQKKQVIECCTVLRKAPEWQFKQWKKWQEERDRNE